MHGRLNLTPLLGGHSSSGFGMRSSTRTSLFWTMLVIGLLPPCKSIVIGVKPTFPFGLVMGGFEYRQAAEIRDSFNRHGVRYLFIGKSGAILLGFPDTTQDADLFVEKTEVNGDRLVASLGELGFDLTPDQAREIRVGKDFIQLKNGPFDLDLIFAPDGIETFEAAWNRRVVVDGFNVCGIDDIIASKKSANRQRDRESLPRLLSFRDWLRSRH